MDSKTHFFFFFFKEGTYMTVEIVSKSHNLQDVLVGLHHLAKARMRMHFNEWLIRNESTHFNYC